MCGDHILSHTTDLGVLIGVRDCGSGMFDWETSDITERNGGLWTMEEIWEQCLLGGISPLDQNTLQAPGWIASQNPTPVGCTSAGLHKKNAGVKALRLTWW